MSLQKPLSKLKNNFHSIAGAHALAADRFKDYNDMGLGPGRDIGRAFADCFEKCIPLRKTVQEVDFQLLQKGFHHASKNIGSYGTLWGHPYFLGYRSTPIDKKELELKAKEIEQQHQEFKKKMPGASMNLAIRPYIWPEVAIYFASAKQFCLGLPHAAAVFRNDDLEHISIQLYDNMNQLCYQGAETEESFLRPSIPTFHNNSRYSRLSVFLEMSIIEPDLTTPEGVHAHDNHMKLMADFLAQNTPV